MEAAAILARFDAEMREDPAPEIGVGRVWCDGVLRTLGAYNLIGWWDFPAHRLAEIVDRETQFFRSRGKAVEWKIFSHDGAQDLEAALAAAGWRGEEPETFVVFDLDTRIPPIDPVAGLDVREVTNRVGFADFLTVNAAANNRPARQSIEDLEKTVDDPGFAYFVAYQAERPVASGGLHLPSGRAFAGLYSGGTNPEYRSRGAYRALVAARAAVARRRGYRFLIVDARETSRPILQRLGFEPLATVCGWTLAGA